MSRVIRRLEVQAVGDDVLARFDGRVRSAVAELLPNEPNALDIRKVPRLPMATVRLTGPAAAVANVIERASGSTGVTVHSDWLTVPGAPPENDYPDQHALARIDPMGVSRRVRGGGERVVVAIVDSGLDVNHPVLKAHVWRKVRSADVADEDGHGTALAGTILATANRVDGLELLPAKFFDVVTQPLADNAARAIHYALDKRATILNLSFDLGIGSNALRDAIRRACSEDVLVVIAAGNTGSNNDDYPVVPASYAQECRDRIITVMATDGFDQKAAFSNFGARTIDLAAPGVDIVSTRRLIGASDRRFYTRYTGTSAATAHVSGAAALLKSQHPTWTGAEIKRRLMDSVDRRPHLRCVSGGRLNLGRALDARSGRCV